VLFHPGSDDKSSLFKEAAVDGGEGGRCVAIDVNFADYVAMRADGDDNLGFCADGTGKIARVSVYVVHDDGFSGGYGGAADALCDRDADVGGWLAVEDAQDQRMRVGRVEPIKAGPIVVREFAGDGLDDGLFEGFERWRGRGQLAEAGEQGEHLRGEAGGGRFHLESMCSTVSRILRSEVRVSLLQNSAGARMARVKQCRR